MQTCVCCSCCRLSFSKKSSLTETHNDKHIKLYNVEKSMVPIIIALLQSWFLQKLCLELMFWKIPGKCLKYQGLSSSSLSFPLRNKNTQRFSCIIIIVIVVTNCLRLPTHCICIFLENLYSSSRSWKMSYRRICCGGAKNFMLRYNKAFFDLHYRKEPIQNITYNYFIW